MIQQIVDSLRADGFNVIDGGNVITHHENGRTVNISLECKKYFLVSLRDKKESYSKVAPCPVKAMKFFVEFANSGILK
jgi:hypothetical protein